MSDLTAEGGSPLGYVAAYLQHLLLLDDYKRRWLARSRRRRSDTVSQAAVSEVIATYLVDEGLASEADEPHLPRSVRSKIGRALRGEVITAETLSWFVGAFRFSASDADELWRRYQLVTRAAETTDEADCLLELVEEGVTVRGRTVVGREKREVVRALVDGVDSLGYYGHPEAIITPLTGENWEFDEENGEHIIWLNRVLSEGETCELRFHVVPDPGARRSGEVDAVLQAFNVPVERYIIRVRFEDAAPELVWYFANEPIGRAYRPNERHKVLPASDGEYHHTFTLTGNGLAAGLGWRWPR